ncbi:hypothetical protein [Amycolatopsis samaneae]|uniref:Uncharacterized protein n=2 Tax=Amycolatopsis samaneae TaxID=664691 RepID=A0ABW5GBQ2_9PSEU
MPERNPHAASAVFTAAEAAGAHLDQESWARYDTPAVRAARELTGDGTAEQEPLDAPTAADA